MFFSIASHAQSEKIETDTTLVQRVDSLEHNLTYLKLICDINETITNIGIITNDIQIDALSLKLDIFYKNFNRKFIKSSIKGYEGNKSVIESLSGTIESQKEYAYIKLLTYSFTESERSLIKQKLEIMESSFKKLKIASDLLKTCIDAYLDLM